MLGKLLKSIFTATILLVSVASAQTPDTTINAKPGDTVRISVGRVPRNVLLQIDTAPSTTSKIDTLFSDGFESGNLSLWDDNVNPGAHSVTIAEKQSGTRALQVNYATGGAGSALSKFVTRSNKLYARYWVKFPINWIGDTKLLLLRGSPSSNQWASFGVAGQCPTGSNWVVSNIATQVPNLDLHFYSYYVGMFKEADGITCWGRHGTSADGLTPAAVYSSGRSISKGVWHLVEFELELNTVGQSNGTQRMWLDGVLKGTWTGLVFRTNPDILLNAVTLELSTGTVTQNQSLWIDNVFVSSARPDTVVVTPPPPVTPVLTALTLSPASITLDTGATTLFAAALTWSDGATRTATVTWTATGGTVTSSGSYKAGATTGTFRVIATSGGIADTAPITIRLPVVTPPPSAGEPVFSVAAGDKSLFFDGFESYTTPVSLTNGAGAYTYVTNYNGLNGIAIATSGAAEGQKYVRFDFQASAPASGEINRLLETYSVGASGNAVVMQYMFRNVGTRHHGKQMIMFGTARWVFHGPSVTIAPDALANCFYNDGIWGTPKTSDVPSWSTSMSWNNDPSGYQFSMNTGAQQYLWGNRINDGQWHRITTRITKEATAGRGRVEMWVDGIKVIEYLGDNAARCEFGKVPTGSTLVRGFQFPTTTSGGGIAWEGGAWLDYDAIRIWTPVGN